MPLTHANAENSRGIGPADLATALRTGRKSRPCGELAYHVLEVMLAVEQSSKSGRHVEIASTCQRPAPIPAGLKDTELDQ
jgi:predicted dehydrogenase